jgi:RNA polymerase sigma-70 factor, ECF subfamily
VDYSALTDQDLVVHALNGREAAHRELIGRYQRPVFSLIVRLVGNREAAEDLAQESFVKVLNALDRYDRRYKFSSWIFKIAHNTAIDHLRRKSPESLSLEGSPHSLTSEESGSGAITAISEAETPEEYTSSREIGREIEKALSALRPEYRSALVLWHVEGRPYEEIAEALDLPLGTVKTYIHRGRKELRDRLAHLRA